MRQLAGSSGSLIRRGTTVVGACRTCGSFPKLRERAIGEPTPWAKTQKQGAAVGSGASAVAPERPESGRARSERRLSDAGILTYSDLGAAHPGRNRRDPAAHSRDIRRTHSQPELDRASARTRRASTRGLRPAPALRRLPRRIPSRVRQQRPRHQSSPSPNRRSRGLGGMG